MIGRSSKSYISTSIYRRQAGKSNKKIYEHTVNLPQTTFSMRANAAQNEIKVRERTTDQLYRWQKEHLPKDNTFILRDGPPYANGPLHMGHALNKIVKDIVNRYQILQGRRVNYIPGWDCHGLPIELKALRDANARISQMTPIFVREKAKECALTAIDIQREQFRKWAIMGDWENPYRTLDPQYEQSQLKVFGKMFQKGLIYRKLKPVYWSPHTQTALAEAELEYKSLHKSESAFVKMKLAQDVCDEHGQDTFALIWTTTPWTLPANKAISVHPDMKYTIVSIENKNYVIASSRLSIIKDLFPDMEVKTVKQDIKGEEMKTWRYINPLNNRESPFICAEFVADDSGTGLVHTAPGHGFDDYIYCQKHGIEPFCPVDNYGKYTEDVGIPDLVRCNIFTTGKEKILAMLRDSDSLVKSEPYFHRYPYDWRSNKPVIIRATKQWFANVSKIKAKAIKSLEDVTIVPETGRQRLIANIQSRSEWCISRQRYWGVPIPVFYHKYTKDGVLMNDEIIEHVANLVGQHGSDCWWTMTVEELLPEKYKHKAHEYTRGRDTMDVWFDSGVSWSLLNERADMYLEGSDQHRGWFQSSLLTSVSVDKGAPFKTLITHGFVNDHHGMKMSKSKGNVIDPDFITDKGIGDKHLALGVDVLRLWVSSTDFTNDVNIGISNMQTMGDSMRKIRNTIRFMLGNLYDLNPKERKTSVKRLNPIDQFMLSELANLDTIVRQGYETYDFPKVYSSLMHFFSSTCSAFYFGSIKDSLYNDRVDDWRRKSSQITIFKMLERVMVMLAPIVPHLAEEIFDHYKAIVKEPDLFSVFQKGWQNVPSEWANAGIEYDFQILQNVRVEVNKQLEEMRQEGKIGRSTDAQVHISIPKAINHAHWEIIEKYKNHLAQLFVTSSVTVSKDAVDDLLNIKVTPSKNHKCPRCWANVSAKPGNLCSRCVEVIDGCKKTESSSSSSL